MSWKETLAAVAPTLATALGGPLAGMAVNMATSALGIDPDENALEQVVMGGDPAKLAQLRQVENDFKLEVEKLGVERERLAASDRDSARKREMEVKDEMPKILGAIVLVSFLGITWSILNGGAAVDSALAGTLIGYVSAKAEQVVSYYFGSSAGSKEKTSHLANRK